MELSFWIAVVAVLYPYLLYPVFLWLWTRGSLGTSDVNATYQPTVSLIIVISNEEQRIDQKIANTAALDYPVARLQVLYVSDGSTDRTVEIIRMNAPAEAIVIDLPSRQGKATALNAGLRAARNDILVFTDASITLEREALRRVVAPFWDPRIGCVSGEDRIAEAGGEAWYGRYELLLRRLESRAHSIVGASGSFYAQRRELCTPFTPTMAPDFLSVLRTVELGYRAICEPSAVGYMTSVKDPRREFERKVRTVIRGLTTLGAYRRLLNPFRYGAFSFALFSHKVMRWLAPAFLTVVLVLPVGMLDRGFYLAVLLAQALFYTFAAAALWRWGGTQHTPLGKASVFFTSTNLAIAVAWLKYLRGVRQELWTPTQR